MSTATEEIIQVCEALPPEKRSEVADFARFLLAQSEDARWEELLAQPGWRPKLDEFLSASDAEADELANRGLVDLLLACPSPFEAPSRSHGRAYL